MSKNDSKNGILECECGLKKSVFHYLDEVWGIERRLRMLARLAQGCNDPDKIDTELLEEMGTMILELIEERRVCDHYFLGRELGDLYTCSKLEAELDRLQRKYASGM